MKRHAKAPTNVHVTLDVSLDQLVLAAVKSGYPYPSQRGWTTDEKYCAAHWYIKETVKIDVERACEEVSRENQTGS